MKSRIISFVLLPIICWSGAVLSSTSLERELVVDGLNRPWDLAFMSADQVLVTEKEGGLVLVDLQTKSKTPIEGLPADLDIEMGEDRRDNSGLFAVELAADFAQSSFLYLSYAAKSPDGTGSTTKLIRARLTGHQLTDIQTLFVAEPYSEILFHYGGGVAVDKQGLVYLTVGERYFSEKPQPTVPVAQDLSDKRGKIYRFNPDGSVPAGNPEWSMHSGSALYALGIRAAQGMTVHPKTGDVWFSEHGASQGDEINRLMPGANYGWPLVTDGKFRSQDYQPIQIAVSLTSPVWSFPNTVAPTGLTFYFGQEFPQFDGDLLVAGLSAGNLWHLSIEDNRITAAQKLFAEHPIRLRSIAQSPDGKVYMTTDERNGRLLRLVNQ